MPLPIAAEIDTWPIRERQPGKAVDLFAIREAPVILPPGRLLRVTEKIGTGDVMMMPDLAGWQHRKPSKIGPNGYTGT